MTECFVYVIGLVFNGKPSRPTKVGISSWPGGRLAALQTASPYELRVVHAFRFEDRNRALDLEWITHKFYSEDRIRGEWFNIEPMEVLDFMVFELDRTRRPEAICDQMGLTRAIAMLAGDA